MEKYKIIKMPDEKFRKSNAWFNECERNGRPFVVIRQKTKFCELRWDYISMCRSGRFMPDDDHPYRIREIMHRYWTLKRPIWIFGPVCDIPRLTLEAAQAAAVEIYDELAAVPLEPI